MRVCAVEFFTGGILAMCKVSDLGLVQSFSFWIGSYLPQCTLKSFCVFLGKHSCTIPGMSYLSLEWEEVTAQELCNIWVPHRPTI